MTIGTQSKYTKFVSSLAQTMQSAGLAKPTLIGVSEAEIANTEVEIGKRIPEILKVWYQYAGTYSGDITHDDMTYTIRDLLHTQKICSSACTYSPLNNPVCQWKLTASTLPFSSWSTERLLIVWTDMGDDPPIYSYEEGEAYPVYVSPSFSSYIRNRILDCIGGRIYGTLIPKLYNRYEEMNISIQEWKKMQNELWTEADKMMNALIETLHTHDIARDEITTLEEFQAEWVAELAKTDILQRANEANVWIPGNWVFPQGPI